MVKKHEIHVIHIYTATYPRMHCSTGCRCPSNEPAGVSTLALSYTTANSLDVDIQPFYKLLSHTHAHSIRDRVSYFGFYLTDRRSIDGRPGHDHLLEWRLCLQERNGAWLSLFFIYKPTFLNHKIPKYRRAIFAVTASLTLGAVVSTGLACTQVLL